MWELRWTPQRLTCDDKGGVDAVVSPWGSVSCGDQECRGGRGCCGLASQGMLLPATGSVHSPPEASAVGVLPSGRKQVMRDHTLVSVVG